MVPECEDLPVEAEDSQYLVDAYREYVLPILIKPYGFNRKIILGENLRWHFVNSAGVINNFVLREFDGLEGATDGESRRLTRELERGFISRLRRGYLIAWGREGSPIRDWSEIPSSAWQYLWPARLRLGVVEGEGVRLFDVRVKRASPLRPRQPKKGPRSSAPIVNKEFDRRVDAGLVGMCLRQEAKYLSKWLGRTHHKEPQLTFKTIENHIRRPFAAWLASPSNS